MDATTVIIGAGHAGLAMSRRLTERSIDHVILEWGEVANSWRTQRWNSLRLLTPKRAHEPARVELPRQRPRRLMTMPEVTAFMRSYAVGIGAPVQTGTT